MNKNLLYLASGPFFEEYKKLDFNEMIFIDRNQRLKNSFPADDKRFQFIGKDALYAIDDLIRKESKIDYLVSVNEGLYGGGGDYPIFSDFLMGYLSPLLNDEIVLICDLNYYSSSLRTPMGKLDWGFEKIEKITENDQRYIDPRIFSYSEHERPSNKYGNIYLMKKINKTTLLNFQNQQANILIHHGSIWEDKNELDFIGLNLRSFYNIRSEGKTHQTTIDQFFLEKPKVFDINNKNFIDIVNYCKDNGCKNIGLTPWLNNDYSTVIKYLQNENLDGIEKICFYHLDKKDYKMLYSLQKI